MDSIGGANGQGESSPAKLPVDGGQRWRARGSYKAYISLLDHLRKMLNTEIIVGIYNSSRRYKKNCDKDKNLNPWSQAMRLLSREVEFLSLLCPNP